MNTLTCRNYTINIEATSYDGKPYTRAIVRDQWGYVSVVYDAPQGAYAYRCALAYCRFDATKKALGVHNALV